MTTDATGALVPVKEAVAPNTTMLMILILIQVLYVCLVYGPIAAYLIEAFPAKIRYTSLSLPYHIGNGVFGGLLPLIGVAMRCRNRQYLCRTLLPDDCRWHNVHRGKFAAERDPRQPHLG